MIRLTLIAAATIILSTTIARASETQRGQSLKDASGETQCPAHAAVAKSTTIDPTTGAIRVRTICVSKSK